MLASVPPTVRIGHAVVPVQKPAHYAVLSGRGRLVRAMNTPTSSVCDEYTNEVMGEGWRGNMHPKGTLPGRKLDGAEKSTVAAGWKTLNFHVKKVLAGDTALKKMKGNTWETLVYGIGLDGESPIIRVIIMERFLKEDDLNSTEDHRG
ncbi:unnamed protein product [Ectocarpus sp. 12 AP-2014]